MLQERQVPGRQLGGVDTGRHGFRTQLRKLCSKNQGAGIVVRRMTFTAVRDREDRVLQYSRVVRHSMQVLKLEFRQLIHRFVGHAGGELHARTSHAVAAYSRETFHVALRHSLPYHVARE